MGSVSPSQILRFKCSFRTLSMFCCSKQTNALVTLASTHIFHFQSRVAGFRVASTIQAQLINQDKNTIIHTHTSKNSHNSTINNKKVQYGIMDQKLQCSGTSKTYQQIKPNKDIIKSTKFPHGYLGCGGVQFTAAKNLYGAANFPFISTFTRLEKLIHILSNVLLLPTIAEELLVQRLFQVLLRRSPQHGLLLRELPHKCRRHLFFDSNQCRGLSGMNWI